jgi:hypothetical protein
MLCGGTGLVDLDSALLAVVTHSAQPTVCVPAMLVVPAKKRALMALWATLNCGSTVAAPEWRTQRAVQCRASVRHDGVGAADSVYSLQRITASRRLAISAVWRRAVQRT